MKNKINRVKQFVTDHDRLFITLASLTAGSLITKKLCKEDFVVLEVSRDQLLALMNEGGKIRYEISPTRALDVYLEDL